MAQKSKTQGVDSPVEAVQEKLVKMQKGDREKQVLEINTQMSALEASINKLGRKLTTTNKQIKTDVERLNSSDVEITDKVTETYRQLGVMENTFQQLSSESSHINQALKKVNTKIKALEKETRSSLKSAMDTQSLINDDMKQSHDDLITRAEKLSKKATSMARKLDKSISENSRALSDLESRVVDELEKIAQSSEQRDNKLDDKISAQKAKMLLMQSVDDALEKRVSTLQTTTQQLLQDSENLKDSTQALDILTSKLCDDVQALESQTAGLAEQNEQQQGMIVDLQGKTDSLGRTLLALVTLEKKHFRTLGSASLLLLLLMLGVFFYGEYSRDTAAALEVQRNAVVNEQLSDLKNRVEDEQLSSEVFYNEISSLGKTIDEVKGEMQQTADQIKSQLQGMTDQVDSIDGRLQYMNPLYNFGTDNTIHGSEWISRLDKKLLSIKIATVDNKQELYEIAQRYSNYFTRDLAYFRNQDQRYTLVYGGNFESEQQVSETIRRMPGYMNNQKISPISNADILQLIKS